MTEITATDVAANRAAWIDALRSGRFAQGTGQLRTVDDEYCCLGVAETSRGADWCVVDRKTDQLIELTTAQLDARPIYAVRTSAVINELERYADVLAKAQPYVSDDDRRLYSVVLSDVGRRWLGLVVSDPYVAVGPGVLEDPAGGDSTYSTWTLSALNDRKQLPFATIADVLADQPASWNGDHEVVLADVRLRNRRLLARPRADGAATEEDR